MAVDSRAALLLVLDWVLLLAVILHPLSRAFDRSDRGAGSRVILEPPRPPSLVQSGAFAIMCVACATLLVGLRNPAPVSLYRHWVSSLTNAVVNQPAVVGKYTDHLIPIFPVTVVAFVLAYATVVPATPTRRIVIALHGLLFVAISVTSDALLGVVGMATGLPLGPLPLLAIVLHYGLGYLVVFRLAFTSLKLPRRTQLPMLRSRRGDRGDDAVLVLAIVASMAAVGSGGIWAFTAVQSDTVLRLLVVIAMPSFALFGIFAVLGLLGPLAGRRPQPTSRRPFIEVIVPAFNEEANIERLLDSIDAAAGAYQGPVGIVLCDDGSTDDTGALAMRAMSRFQHASGRVINGRHGGKSAALNQALAVCTAEYVVRLDADCVMGEAALVYTVPWFLRFADVGMVGALTLPKRPYTTWIDRMRSYEMCLPFGLTRWCKSTVDGVPCIPGTFVAFRREGALAVGGHVEGVFGEDYDFTCAMARIGYRAVVDARIRSFEDVPNTLRQLRIQRVRWSRGGTMVFARYTPFVRRPGGPRFWFFSTIAAGKRLNGPLRVAGFIYLMELTIVDPTYQQNQARYWALFVLSAVPRLLIKVVLILRCGEGRVLLWLPFIYPFALLKRLYQLEALLTFPTRPVLQRGASRSSARGPIAAQVGSRPHWTQSPATFAADRPAR